MGIIYIFNRFILVLVGTGLNLLRIGWSMPRVCVAFLKMLLMCFEKLSVRPIVTPKYLAWEDYGMSAPLMDICDRLLVCFRPNRIEIVLVVFIRRRHLLIQHEAICNCFCVFSTKTEDPKEPLKLINRGSNQWQATRTNGTIPGATQFEHRHNRSYVLIDDAGPHHTRAKLAISKHRWPVRSRVQLSEYRHNWSYRSN